MVLLPLPNLDLSTSCRDRLARRLFHDCRSHRCGSPDDRAGCMRRKTARIFVITSFYTLMVIDRFVKREIRHATKMIAHRAGNPAGARPYATRNTTGAARLEVAKWSRPHPRSRAAASARRHNWSADALSSLVAARRQRKRDHLSRPCRPPSPQWHTFHAAKENDCRG